MSKTKKDLIPETITKEDFAETITNHKFDLKEDFRSKWYYLLSERLDVFRNNRVENYKMSDDEAILYIAFISQWNRANRKITELAYDDFKGFMTKNNLKFIRVGEGKIETLQINDEKIKGMVVDLAQNLKNIKGIGWVGATKILHMRLPEFFVPIDNAIAEQNVYRIDNGRDFGKTYFDFLCKVSRRFNTVIDVWKNNSEIKIGSFNKEKTFAKAIDEYNFLKVHNTEKRDDKSSSVVHG